MSSEEKIKNPRKFLWDDEEDQQQSPSRSGGKNVFLARDLGVDQSINLHDLETVGGGHTSLSQVDVPPSLRDTVAGIFQSGSMRMVGLGGSSSHFDEFGDAAASLEAEEYISDKTRRSPYIWTSFRATCGKLGGSLRSLCRGRRFLLFTAVLLVSGGLIAAIVLGVSGPSQRYVDLTDALREEGLIVNTPSEKKALEWLANRDPAKVGPKQKGMLDRFVLAEFWYSSNGYTGKWTSAEKWMSGDAVCVWEGVECIPRSAKEGGKDSVTKRYNDHDFVEAVLLPGHNMKGNVPEDFMFLRKCLTVDFQDNQLSGSLPHYLEGMASLRNLLLRKNKFSGSFPVEWTTMSKIRQLHLGSNQLKGSIPMGIQEMSSLESLSLSENMFTGVPPFHGNTNLVTLYLDDNDFKGPLPDWVKTLTNLKELRLDHNSFEGELSDILEGLVALEVLRIENNKISGTLPEKLKLSEKLRVLRLSKNQLSGSIPEELHLQMRLLYLDNNALTGSLPTKLGSMLRLEELALHNNNLTGTIDTKLGKLSDMTHLSLNNNMFSGSIPTELGGCSQLELLHLQSNKITGSIPTELGALDKLTELKLDDNLLKGTMPNALCSKVTSEEISYLSADCKSEVSCSCCTDCN